MIRTVSVMVLPAQELNWPAFDSQRQHDWSTGNPDGVPLSCVGSPPPDFAAGAEASSLRGHGLPMPVAGHLRIEGLGHNAEPLHGGLQDLRHELRVAHALEARHDVHLPVPAPARVGIDLEQLDFALLIGTEIEAGVVAASQALKQTRGMVDQL